MAKPARTAVDLDDDLAEGTAHPLGGLFVENFIDHIHFDEMVACAQRAELWLRRV